jgi:hypothetical protein
MLGLDFVAPIIKPDAMTRTSRLAAYSVADAMTRTSRLAAYSVPTSCNRPTVGSHVKSAQVNLRQF